MSESYKQRVLLSTLRFLVLKLSVQEGILRRSFAYTESSSVDETSLIFSGFVRFLKRFVDIADIAVSTVYLFCVYNTMAKVLAIFLVLTLTAQVATSLNVEPRCVCFRAPCPCDYDTRMPGEGNSVPPEVDSAFSAFRKWNEFRLLCR